MASRDAEQAVNAVYYGTVSEGRADYWRYMAAPRHRVEVILGQLEQLRPTALIDLGCGDGSLLSEIRRRLAPRRLAGLDLSAEQIAVNRRMHPELEWHCADLLRPWPSDCQLPGGFDTVVACELIEHLEDPGALLRAARQVMAAEGGRLVLSTQSGPMRETERRVGHVRHYSAAQMRSLLGAHGWRPLAIWNTGYPFHDLSKWYANLDPDASLRRYGGERYGAGQRLVCWLLRAAFRFNSRHRGAQLFAVAERVGA